MLIKTKIIRRCCVILMLSVLCGMFAGCGRQTVQESAEPLVWEMVNERVQNGSAMADYEKTAYNGIVYHFESGIFDGESRSAYIAAINAFYDKAKEAQPDFSLESGRLTVYVGDSLTTQGTEGKAFIQSQEIVSNWGMTAVLMSMMSEAVNYGQAYGIAAYLCGELGMSSDSEQSIYSDDELAAFYGNSEQLFVLDFFLPYFEPLYIEEKTAAYARASAVSFEKYYIEKNGLESALRLCKMSERDFQNQSVLSEAEITLTAEKNEWLNKIGVRTSVQTTLYQPASYRIPFYRNLSDNGVTYPYLVKTQSVEWYPALADVQKMGCVEFIAGFADTLSVQEADFAQAREVLENWIERDIPAVRIYTDFADVSKSSQYLGAFYSQGNYIKLFHSWQQAQYNLLHEYVHYLTIRHGKNKTASGFWGEGIAEEVAVMECENQIANLFWRQNVTEEAAKNLKQFGMWDTRKEVVNARLQQMCEAACMYLGYGNNREYWSVGQEQLIRTVDSAAHIKPSQLSYSEAAGVMAYLMAEYGQEAVFTNCHDSNRIHTAFDQSFPELYDAWGQWNIRQCEDAGIDLDALGKYINGES